MPKFIFLQYVDEAKAPAPGTPEMQAQIDAFAKYFEAIQVAGIMKDGDPCQPNAATFTVEVRDGATSASDGPMSAQAPWLNGYFVLECKDRADAEDWAARNPTASVGSVEVHPILTLS